MHKLEVAPNTYAYVRETKDNIKYSISNNIITDYTTKDIALMKKFASNKNYMIGSFYKANLVKSIIYNGKSYEIEQITESNQEYEIKIDIQ